MEHSFNSLIFSASNHKNEVCGLADGGQRESNAPWHHYTLGHKAIGKEQIPKGLSQQTMMGPTKGLNVTTSLQNQITKKWKLKIFALL